MRRAATATASRIVNPTQSGKDVWLPQPPSARRKCMFRNVTTCVFVAAALIALSATRAAAQNPYSIESPNAIVTDSSNSGVAGGYSVPPCDSPSPEACKQNDPFGTKELSPINGSTTKIGVI